MVKGSVIGNKTLHFTRKNSIPNLLWLTLTFNYTLAASSAVAKTSSVNCAIEMYLGTFFNVFPKRPNSIFSFSMTAILASVSEATNANQNFYKTDVVAPIDATCVAKSFVKSSALSTVLF